MAGLRSGRRALRFAVVAQGRFHTFDLARALLGLGHDVELFTNYSHGEVEKFGIRANRVASFRSHRLVSRALRELPARLSSARDAISHTLFGRWAARRVQQSEAFDAIYCMSGVATEMFRASSIDRPIRLLVRGSSHVDAQHEILSRLGELTGCRVETPSDWIRSREREEYRLAHRVIVLSEFAAQSFMAHEFPPEHLWLIPSASDAALFSAADAVIEERIKRLGRGKRLHVLFAGSFCYRKGAVTLAHVVRRLSQRMDFSIVGSVDRDCLALAESLRGFARFRGRIPHQDLPSVYRDADVFLFPTVEDGYPATLAQAIVSGLVVVASRNCSAPDLIVDGKTGFLLNAMDDGAFCSAIERIDGDRAAAAEIARASKQSSVVRSWNDMALDLTEKILLMGPLETSRTGRTQAVAAEV